MSGTAARGDLEIFPDAASLAWACAESFAELASEAQRRGGRFAAVLTGGSSPVDLYRLLGSDAFARRVPWEAVHLFWGDERCVPPRHFRSNFRMASDLLLRHVPIPPENVHRIGGEMGAAQAAAEYEGTLRAFFAGGDTRFDLVHLGVGGDGHVASLFPFDLPRLLERERLVMPALHPDLGEPRVTLSPAAINAAARVEVLFPDAGKAAIARRVIEGPLDPLRIPAQLVRPVFGKVVWRTTRDAAQNLRAG